MPVTLPRRNPLITQSLVIGALIQREIKTRFGRYQLGFIWFFVEPLLSVLVVGLLLGNIVGRTAPAMPYAMFLLNGFMLLKLFSGPMTAGLHAIKSSKGLLVFPGVRPLDPFIAKFVFELVTTIIVFTVFCGVAMWIGIDLSLEHLDLLFGAFIVTWVGGCGLGLIFGVAAAYYQDLEKIIPVIQRPLIFLSCVLHPAYTLPSSAKDILAFNPLMHTIELSRHALFPLYHSEGMNLVYPSLFAIVSLALGIIVFRAHRHFLTQR